MAYLTYAPIPAAFQQAERRGDVVVRFTSPLLQAAEVTVHIP